MMTIVLMSMLSFVESPFTDKVNHLSQYRVDGWKNKPVQSFGTNLF